MIRCSAVYLVKDNLIIHSSSRTIHGVWILTEPILKIAKDDLVAIGDAVQAALMASKSDVSHPASWEKIEDPLLKIAGVKSYSALVKIAKCVEIEYGGNDVMFISTVNLGPKEGFEQLNDAMISAPFEDKTLLAKSLIEAFDGCE